MKEVVKELNPALELIHGTTILKDLCFVRYYLDNTETKTEREQQAQVMKEQNKERQRRLETELVGNNELSRPPPQPSSPLSEISLLFFSRLFDYRTGAAWT